MDLEKQHHRQRRQHDKRRLYHKRMDKNKQLYQWRKQVDHYKKQSMPFKKCGILGSPERRPANRARGSDGTSRKRFHGNQMELPRVMIGTGANKHTQDDRPYEAIPPEPPLQ